jgi:hypothetical protein
VILRLRIGSHKSPHLADVIGHVVFEWSSHYFVAYNPPLGLLFAFLLGVTFLGIGYFATRFPVLQSAFARESKPEEEPLPGDKPATTVRQAPCGRS